MSHWHRQLRAARSAVQKLGEDAQVKHRHGKTYVNGRLVYDSDQQEDQTLYSDDEEFKLKLYASALEDLAVEDQKFNANYNRWQGWDKATRLWWIRQIEDQAQRGMNTIGVLVVARAVEVRLTRSME